MALIVPPGTSVDPRSEASGGANGPHRSKLRRFVGNTETVVAAVFLLVVVACALLAPLMAPRDPNAQDLLHRFAGPSGHHWLGTDDLGRDLLSRVIYGARVSVRVSVEAVALGLVVALPFGLFSGYVGGWVDNVVMRVADGGLAFPPLVLALAVAGVLGRSLNDTVLAIGVVFVPGLMRLVRGQALAVREETFIDASRAVGTPARRIVWKRLFPHVRSALIVAVSLGCGAALLAEAGLSFLGLGAQPPTATWGAMLREAYDQAVFTDGWQLLLPGAAIALTVLAFNTVGDALRDVLGVARITAERRSRRGLTTVQPSRAAPMRRVATDSSASVAAAAASPLLIVDGLTVAFQSDRAPIIVVDDVSFSIEPGEVLGLVGESGSGKTVTTLAITRLLASPPARITAGSIIFDGVELLDAGFEDVRRVRGMGIALVPQDPMNSLNPAFTVGNQLVEAVRLHQDVTRAAATRRAIELLELASVPQARTRLSQYPHQLSGGMRQRVMIAMALSCSPKLLIADEPTTALDVTIQAEILELLRRLQRDLGMAMLFVTHDLGVVAEVCDTVAVMYAGQIVERSPIGPLFAAPAHPYTAGLLAAMPQGARRGQELVTIPGVVPAPGHLPPGCRFHTRCPYATADCAASPVALEAIDRRHVRCIRSGELRLRGSS